MVLKIQRTSPQESRIIRADLLMSSGGSYAAVDALASVAAQHTQKALRDADTELADHWQEVYDILTEAKRKIAEIK